MGDYAKCVECPVGSAMEARLGARKAPLRNRLGDGALMPQDEGDDV